MKKISTLLATGLLSASLCASALADGITLVINDETIMPSVAPIQENGTTLVPIRVVSENLGASVDWNGEIQGITITKGEKVLALTLGQTTAMIDGVAQELALAPKSIDGTTMVPIRFVSENLDCGVEWNGETQTVAIKSNAATVSPSETLPAQTITPAEPVAEEPTAPSSVNSASSTTANANTIVYVTKTGEKYHLDGCDSLRRSKYETTLGEAINSHLDPCEKCNPPVLN